MDIQNRIIRQEDADLSQIMFNPDNWREHPKYQKDALLAVLKNVGYVQNVIINERTGHLLDGHLRCELAVREGETTIPANIVDIDESEEKIILATLDPIAGMAQTDKDKLTELLAQIETDDDAVNNLLEELATRNGLDKERTTKDVEEYEPEYEVKSGQVWMVDGHLLMCGDAQSADDVAFLFDNKQADMTFTSPPYNIGKSAVLRDGERESLYEDYDDDKPALEYLGLLTQATDQALEHSEYVFLNVQMLSGNKSALIDYLYNYKIKLADIAVWHKSHAAPAMAENVMNSQFEFIFVLSRTGTRAIGTKHFRGTVSNIYTSSPSRNKKYAGVHAATFPLELPMHFIENFTKNGDIVYDPFLGTGTTLMACENLGRTCCGMDIDPNYVSLALSRYKETYLSDPILMREK